MPEENAPERTPDTVDKIDPIFSKPVDITSFAALANLCRAGTTTDRIAEPTTTILLNPLTIAVPTIEATF